jgi:hypothetical protein
MKIALPFKKTEKPKLNKQKLKKAGAWLGIAIVALTLGKLGYKKLYNKTKYDYTYQEEANFGDYWLSMYGKEADRPEKKPEAEQKVGETKKVVVEKVSYMELEVPDNVMVRDILEVDDKGAVRITIDGTDGFKLSAEEVLEFHKKEFENAGWKVTSQEGSTPTVDAHAHDGTYIRVWVFYEGSGDGEFPLTYMVDFQPSGADIMPLPYN